MTIFPQVYMQNLQKDVNRYTINPLTRYTGLRSKKPRMDVKQLYDTDTLPKSTAVGRIGMYNILTLKLIAIYLFLTCRF